MLLAYSNFTDIKRQANKNESFNSRVSGMLGNTLFRYFRDNSNFQILGTLDRELIMSMYQTSSCTLIDNINVLDEPQLKKTIDNFELIFLLTV